MTLRPNKLQDYREAHDQIWPELAKGMRDNSVSMAIHVEGETLFLFAAAPSEAHWDRSRQDPVLKTWDARMTKFLQTDCDGNIAFRRLPKVFGFGEFR